MISRNLKAYAKHGICVLHGVLDSIDSFTRRQKIIDCDNLVLILLVCIPIKIMFDTL